jgi:hypothetical protein
MRLEVILFDEAGVAKLAQSRVQDRGRHAVTPLLQFAEADGTVAEIPRR